VLLPLRFLLLYGHVAEEADTPPERGLGGVVSDATLEKFRRRYASVKGKASLRRRRKPRHKALGRQILTGNAEIAQAVGHVEAQAVLELLPVFHAAVTLTGTKAVPLGRGVLRIAGKSEVGKRIPSIDEDDLAILMMLAA
jgi:hypothetical protein